MTELIPDRHPRARRFAAAAGVLVALAAISMLTSLAVSASGIDELRGDIPTVAEIEAEIARIADDREYNRIQLDVAEARLAQRVFERDHLDEDARAMALEIAEITEALQGVAVETYIIGGNRSIEIEFVADVAITRDLLWTHSLIGVHAAEADAALQRLIELRGAAAADLLAIVDEIAALHGEIRVLNRQIRDLDDLVVKVSAERPLAEAWDYASTAVANGDWGIAPAEGWAQLRFCESSDDYQAVSPSGEYRGAYQFDIETWQSVGGSGDPAAAPPSEQDARARALYALRGPQPWPVCGRFLR